MHGLWNILTLHGASGGYSRHPETRRWVGRTRALYARHDALVLELVRRGYRHRSPLDGRVASGAATQPRLVTPIADQVALLSAKPCACLVEPLDGVPAT